MSFEFSSPLLLVVAGSDHGWYSRRRKSFDAKPTGTLTKLGKDDASFFFVRGPESVQAFSDGLRWATRK